MTTLRVKITMADGEVWYATAPPSNASIPARIRMLNRIALREHKAEAARYDAATEAEYQEYKNPRPARKFGVDIDLSFPDTQAGVYNG